MLFYRGTYVEKVLGVERDNYFNAGMLVINCEQFRKNHVLEQFMELLPMYNFVVTQDEDYLNLICHMIKGLIELSDLRYIFPLRQTYVQIPGTVLLHGSSKLF